VAKIQVPNPEAKLWNGTGAGDNRGTRFPRQMDSDWPPIPPVSKNLGDYRASQSENCQVAMLKEEKRSVAVSYSLIFILLILIFFGKMGCSLNQLEINSLSMCVS
jgi:hypothetical protein